MTTREQLLHLLAEASELEHNILCSYLYAVFSLKQEASEDLTPAELAEVQRWRSDLMSVCIEEMVHLAQVANLAASLGGRPHFNRPNLPVAPGYHPAGISVRLSPLDLPTLEHFIFLERPEEVPLADGEGFAQQADGPSRGAVARFGLMPAAPDYRTIGEFYGRLARALQGAAARLGEAQLFCGAVSHQLRPSDFKAEDLVVVTDLASARRAIDFIVEQGEGSPAAAEESHFQRFDAMRARYLQMQQARPGFCPHRPAAADPVMRRPTEPGRTQVTAQPAADVLDLANGCYAAMLRALAHLYEVPWERSRDREALATCAIACMHLLALLGSHLTTLPAEHGGAATAGLTFTVLRATEGYTAEASPAVVLGEWLERARQRVDEMGLPGPLAASLRSALAPALGMLAESAASPPQ